MQEPSKLETVLRKMALLSPKQFYAFVEALADEIEKEKAFTSSTNHSNEVKA